MTVSLAQHLSALRQCWLLGPSSPWPRKMCQHHQRGRSSHGCPQTPSSAADKKEIVQGESAMSLACLNCWRMPQQLSTEGCAWEGRSIWSAGTKKTWPATSARHLPRQTGWAAQQHHQRSTSQPQHRFQTRSWWTWCHLRTQSCKASAINQRRTVGVAEDGKH